MTISGNQEREEGDAGVENAGVTRTRGLVRRKNNVNTKCEFVPGVNDYWEEINCMLLAIFPLICLPIGGPSRCSGSTLKTIF